MKLNAPKVLIKGEGWGAVNHFLEQAFVNLKEREIASVSLGGGWEGVQEVTAGEWLGNTHERIALSHAVLE